MFAYSHGTDVSVGAMRVPLIIRGYGLPLAEGAVVKSQASMSGLAPTIERSLGFEPSLGERRNFWSHIRPGPMKDRDGWPENPTWPVFYEATRPLQHESTTGWNNIRFYRGVRAGGWAMNGAPVFGIGYDFDVPVPEADRPVLYWLRYLLQQWDGQTPGYVEVEMAPATKRALTVLGYLEED
ncbi:MAG: hypothetical protein HN348_07800 [Proteobacteria bacterium]|nr:hypothetical protein [Pseudomonadota bacterium]